MAANVNLAAFFLLFSIACGVTAADVLDVRSFGIMGKHNITLALQKAFTAACNSTIPSKLLIPAGVFSLGEVVLQGPCKSPIEFEVQGTVKAARDPRKFKTDGWITFNYIDSFHMYGGGVFDGQGLRAWNMNSCHKNFTCPNLATNLRFNYVTNGLIEYITTKDSKFFHVNVLGCKNFTFDHFTVTAPGDSRNTDGIHIGRSTGVNITNTNIGTGDDCISLGDGCQDLHVEGVTCGPGHGISVGSLGRYPGEEPVVGFYVKNCTLKGTQNGVRIKSWPTLYPGTVSEMHFEDVQMIDVGNPVIIDQEYCPWNLCNKASPSLVKISNVSFNRIYGTSTTCATVTINCSKGVPCQNVQVGDIDLVYNGTEGSAVSSCSNVNPSFSGRQNPTACSVPAN